MLSACSLLHAAWDCSAWVRTYALCLEERVECFRFLKYDAELDRLLKLPQASGKVALEVKSCGIDIIVSCLLHVNAILNLGKFQAHSRTRTLPLGELLDQLPAFQELLLRLIYCQVYCFRKWNCVKPGSWNKKHY
jgi:hypothetical protein